MEGAYVFEALYSACIPSTNNFCPLRLDLTDLIGLQKADDKSSNNESSQLVQFITKNRRNKYNWWTNKRAVKYTVSSILFIY